MTSSEIRTTFLDFFASKGHAIVPSAPLVIKDDPTLMFTNAGMNRSRMSLLVRVRRSIPELRIRRNVCA